MDKKQLNLLLLIEIFMASQFETAGEKKKKKAIVLYLKFFIRPYFLNLDKKKSFTSKTPIYIY